MSVDIRTLALAIAAASSVAACILLAYWRTQRTYPGFGYWITANFLVTASFLLFGLRDVLPGIVSIGFANLAAMAAVALRFESARQFHGKPGFGGRSIAAVLLVSPLVLYFTVARDDAVIRMVLVSSVVVAYVLLIGWAFVEGATPGRGVVAGILAALHIFTGAIVAARAVAWMLVPAERGLFAPTPFNLVFFFSQLVVDIGVSVSFLALHAQRAAADLEESQRKLEALASIDALTGALNRRTFFYRAEAEFARGRRLHQPLGVLMLDLDLFKQVNDSMGHAAGDAALKHVISVVGGHLREIDRIGRLGGEEFAILLPSAPLAGADIAGERLRAAVAEAPVTVDKTTFRLTVSVGVAELSPGDADVDSLLKRADEALYEAKRKGRNRVEVAPPPGSVGFSEPDGMPSPEPSPE